MWAYRLVARSSSQATSKISTWPPSADYRPSFIHHHKHKNKFALTPLQWCQKFPICGGWGFFKQPQLRGFTKQFLFLSNCSLWLHLDQSSLQWTCENSTSYSIFLIKHFFRPIHVLNASRNVRCRGGCGSALSSSTMHSIGNGGQFKYRLQFACACHDLMIASDFPTLI
jgi:hypothetical protein